MLILHAYHLSPFNEKLQRMLNHKGVPFEERFWSILKRKDVMGISPSGKLPAIEHEGRIIVDSTDAARYIEETFPQNPLIPDRPQHRAMVHVLEDWADESLYFYEMKCRFATPGNQQRNLPRMLEHENAFAAWLMSKLMPRGLDKILANQGVGRKDMAQLRVDVERHCRAVADLLEGNDWLVNNQLSLGDLAVYAMFQALRDADFVQDMLQSFPTVVDWMQRIEDTTSARAGA